MTVLLMLVFLIGAGLFIGALIVGVLFGIPMLWDMATGTGSDEDREKVGLGCVVLFLVVGAIYGLAYLLWAH